MATNDYSILRSVAKMKGIVAIGQFGYRAGKPGIL